MRRVSAFVLLLLFTAALAVAQERTPVVSAAREILTSREKNMVAAAQEMPEEKYSFKPTPQQVSFGHMVEHMAKSNFFLCSKLSGTAASEPQATEKDGKAKLVGALQSSFAFCAEALGKLDDARMGDPVELWGGKKSTKAAALLDLTNDWADHYAGAAIYLRLNGLLPPTAKAKD